MIVKERNNKRLEKFTERKVKDIYQIHLQLGF